MIQNSQGAITAVGDVMLSAWRRPYLLDGVDDVARVHESLDPQRRGTITWLSLYRFDRVRAADFADATVRRRMGELGRVCRFKMVINVLDGPGLVNSTIRLGLAGLATLVHMPYPVKTVERIDAGLDLCAGADRAALLRALHTLERAVWPIQNTVAPVAPTPMTQPSSTEPTSTKPPFAD